MNIKILSFDPGLKNLGYSVFETTSEGYLEYIKSGSLTQKTKGVTEGGKLCIAYNTILELADKFKPTHIGYELMFIPKRHSSGAGTMKVIGLIEMTAHKYHAETYSVAPPTLKKFITSKGKASKDDMRRGLLSKLGKSEDHNPYLFLNEKGSSKFMKLIKAPHHEIDACSISLWVHSMIKSGV